MCIKISKFIPLHTQYLKNLKEWRFLPICIFKETEIDHFFHYLYFREGPGSETSYFQFEDPDQDLIILDPEHWLYCLKGTHVAFAVGFATYCSDIIVWFE